MPSTTSLGDDEYVVIESDRKGGGVGDTIFKTGGVERARIKADGTGTGWSSMIGGSRPFVGTADPSPTLTAGTEYVWFQTDGTGNLIDLWTGVV